MTMQSISQRRVFTVLMTLLATAFGVAIAGLKFGGQADVLTDLLKVGGLIAVSALGTSFFIWTVTHLKADSLRRGALAGALTAALLVPLPMAAWRFKTEILDGYQSPAESLFVAFASAISPAINAGLYTFVDITKVSVIAVIASLVLGTAIAHYITPRTARAGL